MPNSFGLEIKFTMELFHTNREAVKQVNLWVEPQSLKHNNKDNESCTNLELDFSLNKSEEESNENTSNPEITEELI